MSRIIKPTETEIKQLGRAFYNITCMEQTITRMHQYGGFHDRRAMIMEPAEQQIIIAISKEMEKVRALLRRFT